MKSRIKYYKQNGDRFCGYVETDRIAQDRLRQAGYNKCYVGRDSVYPNETVYVGINKSNTIGLKQREKNGLLGATELEL